MRIGLEVFDERAVLKRCEVDQLIEQCDDAEGRWAELRPSDRIDEESLRAVLIGRTGGDALPSWHDGEGGRFRKALGLFRVKNVLHIPDLGAIIDKHGRVYKSSIGHALYYTPTLAKLVGVEMVQGVACMDIPSKLDCIERGTVFLSWGGLRNYGHFMLDNLVALAVVDKSGLLDHFPPCIPPLEKWQADLLKLFLGDTRAAVTVESPILKISEVIFASPMDHFLSSPNEIVRILRERLLSNLDHPPSGTLPRRIYLSRRGNTKRIMHNELELEHLLEEEGFAVIQPETMPVYEQIETFREAELIVGPTGAAFANCLFAPAGCQVVEIQPDKFTGVWVRNLCEELDIEWNGFFCRATLEPNEVVIEGVAHAIHVHFELPLETFMTFLRTRIDAHRKGSFQPRSSYHE